MKEQNTMDMAPTYEMSKGLSPETLMLAGLAQAIPQSSEHKESPTDPTVVAKPSSAFDAAL